MPLMNLKGDYNDGLTLAKLADYAYFHVKGPDGGRQRVWDEVRLFKVLNEEFGLPDRSQLICRHNADKDTQYMVLRVEQDIVVAFRGSEPNGTDWLDTDFDMRLRDADGFPGELHDGFADAYETVRPQLRKDIDALCDGVGSPRIWFTGHSLGGALAVIAAYRCHVRKPGAVTGVYTYGAPRSGSYKFAEEYNKLLFGRTFRFVNPGDKIPSCPPDFGYRSFGIDYEHVGREVSLPDKTKTIALFIRDPLHAHSMELYVKNVRFFRDVLKRANDRAVRRSETAAVLPAMTPSPLRARL